MNNQTIVCCVVALLLGMLLANMLKNVCGCKVVEGQRSSCISPTCDSKTTGGACIVGERGKGLCQGVDQTYEDALQNGGTSFGCRCPGKK